MKQLINPHAHSDYSLDGAAKVKDIVKRNKELGASYVTLTEHGNLNSAMELYTASKKEGLKPILGIELYVEPPFTEELRKIIESELNLGPNTDISKKEQLINQKLKSEYVHLTVHFKDEWAYHYFTSLTPIMESRAVVKFGERKPIITIEELAKASGHITICSGCVIGMVSKFLLPRKKTKITRPDLAEKAYLLLKEIAGKDNFFVEVFPHEVTHSWTPPSEGKEGAFVRHECTPENPTGDIQKPVNLFLMNLAKKYNDRIIVSLDSHYATKDQKIVQDARLGNGQEKWKFFNHYHVMSSEEAFTILQRQIGIDKKTFEGWVDNSYIWASHFDRFAIQTSAERWVLPSLPENYKTKLIEKINNVGRMNWNDAAMLERLKYEIDVLSNNGKVNLLSYFFTVEEIANYCIQNDILINVRGSAGGSLLLYVLGVSAVNPLKHNLSFERFLTLGRIKANTLPDVDIDVADQEGVMNFLKNRHGEAFCRISVDVGLKLKSSIKDAERAILGKVRESTEKLCVTLPKPVQGLNEEQWVFGYEEDGVFYPGIADTYLPLKTYKAENPQIWSAVEEMLGIIRQKSQHACGVVIADKPVHEYIPVTKIGETFVTGFSPKSLELAGLVKYDILGLNTLKDLYFCLKIIKEKRKIKIDPFSLPHDDKVFDDLCNGDTATVFQFDTDTVRPYLMAIKPRTIDELGAVTALCRPGTLDAPAGIHYNGKELSLAELYILRSQKKLPILYVHPDLEPILKESFGIQLYQEHTLQIFRNIVGYTYEQAEEVRRGIGKKDAAVLEKCMGDLRRVCLEKKWTEEQVDLLVEQIMASARYAFNKSHAISYAYVAYACAYLKHHYPVEWWYAILRNASKKDLKKFYLHYEKYLEMPHINESDENFKIIETADGKTKILAPITIVEGVGAAAVQEIISKRPFKDFKDFIDKVELRVVNKKVLERLIMAGLLDPLFPKNYTLIDKFNELLSERRRRGFKDGAEDFRVITTLSTIGRLIAKRRVYNLLTIDWSKVVASFCVNESSDERYTYKDWTFFKYGQAFGLSHPTHTNKVGVPISTAKDIMTDMTSGSGEYVAFLGFVEEESDFTYNKKGVEHTARKFLVEIEKHTFELVKFPEWEKTHHGLSESYEGNVVLFLLKKYYSNKTKSIQTSIKAMTTITI